MVLLRRHGSWLICFGLFFTAGIICRGYAGNIFEAAYSSQADAKVFIVKYKSEADLCVYVADHESQARGRDEIWYYVRHKSRSVASIYFVEYASQADIKVFFVKYKSTAGWQKSNKYRGRLK